MASWSDGIPCPPSATPGTDTWRTRADATRAEEMLAHRRSGDIESRPATDRLPDTGGRTLHQRTAAGSAGGCSGTPDGARRYATNRGLLNQAEKHESTNFLRRPGATMLAEPLTCEGLHPTRASVIRSLSCGSCPPMTPASSGQITWLFDERRQSRDRQPCTSICTATTERPDATTGATASLVTPPWPKGSFTSLTGTVAVTPGNAL
jgi:hypothetical protein